MSAPRPSFFRRNLTTRRILTGCLGGAGLAVALAAGGALADSRPGTPEAQVLPVELASVQPVDSYTTTRAYSGRLRSPRALDLAFPLAGELSQVRVSEGSRVTRGEVIATLDLRGLAARRARLAASLAGARARLAELRAGPRRETIAAARARLAAAKAQLDLWAAKARRRESLRRAGVVHDEELEEVRHTHRAQTAQVEVTRRLLAELEAGTRPEQVAAGKARVDELQAGLAQLAVEEDDRTLRAPYSGTVGAVHAEEGAVLAAGKPVLRFVERAALEAWVGVPPAQVGPAVVGSSQLLLVEGREVQAEVKALLPELDPVTRTRTVVLTLPADQPDALAGQIVRLVLSDHVQERGTWLPLSALSKGEREVWTCFVLADEEQGPVVRRALVRVLHVEPERVFVDGLTAGEHVVVSGSHRLVPGQRVSAKAAPLSEAPQ
jgi:RND family efflux transporter MFP subunit